jgi:hypothetical protein
MHPVEIMAAGRKCTKRANVYQHRLFYTDNTKFFTYRSINIEFVLLY